LLLGRSGVASSRRLAFGGRNFARFHDTFEASQIFFDLLRRLFAEKFAIVAPTMPPGGSYSSETLTSVPRPAAPSLKRTEPALSTSAFSSERHAINSFGLSLMTSASHSTVVLRELSPSANACRPRPCSSRIQDDP
jgi:hypothetical protein